MSCAAAAAIAGWLAGTAHGGEPLPVMSDAPLVQVLADLEHVVTQSVVPYYVKIFSRPERGECGGTPESCPKIHLYVVVSTLDEYPETKVYLLPAAFGWSFERFGPSPERESQDHYLSVFLARKILSAEPAKSWFVEERLRIDVNLWRGTLERIGTVSRD
jgi:hypothetical protein